MAFLQGAFPARDHLERDFVRSFHTQAEQGGEPSSTSLEQLTLSLRLKRSRAQQGEMDLLSRLGDQPAQQKRRAEGCHVARQAQLAEAQVGQVRRKLEKAAEALEAQTAGKALWGLDKRRSGNPTLASWETTAERSCFTPLLSPCTNSRHSGLAWAGSQPNTPWQGSLAQADSSRAAPLSSAEAQDEQRGLLENCSARSSNADSAPRLGLAAEHHLSALEASQKELASKVRANTLLECELQESSAKLELTRVQLLISLRLCGNLRREVDRLQLAVTERDTVIQRIAQRRGNPAQGDSQDHENDEDAKSEASSNGASRAAPCERGHVSSTHGMCRACHDAPAAAVVLPCRHFALCKGCAKESPYCPVCESRIDAVFHVEC